MSILNSKKLNYLKNENSDEFPMKRTYGIVRISSVSQNEENGGTGIPNGVNNG